MPDLKTCTRCRKELVAASFRCDARLRSGLASACKGCEAEKSRAYRIANPGKHRAAVKRWQVAHPELTKQHQRAAYDRDPEKYKARALAYQNAHPEQVRRIKNLNKQKRRAVMQEHVPAWVVRELFTLFDNLCAYCKTAQARHIDHIQPLARGGRHIATNLAPACAKCNQTKSARTPEEFAARTGADVRGVVALIEDKFGPKPS